MKNNNSAMGAMPMSSFNRRQFLLGAMSGFSVIGAGGCASVFGREKIRLAVVGMMGKGLTDWLPMVRSGKAEVVAFCDADANYRLESARLVKEHADEWGVAIDILKVPFYTDYRRMLDDDAVLQIDAMTISTPDHMHAAIAVQAMEMGIHVYVQKPLVRTLWEAKRFYDVARASKVVTQMGNQGSAGDGFRRNVEIVRSGILGEVREVHVWTNRPVWPQGFAARDAATKRPETVPPDGLDWDSWLGVAALRPYRKDYEPGSSASRFHPGVYHRFNWRGFFDFGAGAFGDMACHTMNLPFRGLELGEVLEAEGTDLVEVNDVAFPTRSTVRLVYAARDSKFRPGVKLPAVTLYWHDGDQQCNGEAIFADKMRQIVAMPAYAGKVPRTGCLLIGSRGILCSCADYGQQAFFAFNDEEVARDTTKHEACKAVSASIPRRADRPAGGMTAASGAAALSADGHYVEFLDAIAGNGPHFAETGSRCYSDVEFSVPMMEGILVGTVAQRVPGVLKWNSASQEFANDAANRLVRPFVRSGWRI